MTMPRASISVDRVYLLHCRTCDQVDSQHTMRDLERAECMKCGTTRRYGPPPMPVRKHRSGYLQERTNG